MLNVLEIKFDKTRINKLITYFSGLIEKFEQGDWENSLVKSGKFVEVTIKLLWIFAGKKLPKAKEFKAGVYAQKIIAEVIPKEIPSDGIRLQIPRACIFLYDITSNRGGRHDSDEFNPNQMDAFISLELCKWILAELVRFCTSNGLSPDEAQKIVESLIEKRYPVFEEIEGRVYVDDKKHKTANQCALMVLYKRFPKRINKDELTEAVMRHNYKKSTLRFSRLSRFVDSDEKGILLRSAGRKEVEKLLAG